MAIDGINTAGMQANFMQAETAKVGSGPQGTFMGHTVSVAHSPESLLADAAEELGFAVDSTDDYEIDERKQRESSDIADRLRKLYEALMHETGKSRQIEQAVDSLKQAANRQAMRHVLQNAFADVTDGWAALEHALEEFDKDPSVTPEQRTELRALRDEYVKENGQAIKLGLQGALAGRDFPELGGTDVAKDLYRQTVGEFSSVNEVFTEIKNKFGVNFDKAMDFLFAAISQDIDCETPSMGRAHLESVHAKLGLVRLTQSAFRLCEDVMNRWENVHNIKNCPMKAMDLLGSIVGLCGKSYIGMMNIQEIVRKAAPPDLEYEVLFTQELLAAVRKFPDALFEGDKGRETITDAIQAAVDDVVQREDEWLASLE